MLTVTQPHRTLNAAKESEMLTGVEFLTAAATAPQARKIFESVASRLTKAFSGPARSAAIKVLASLEGYSAYLAETNERVSMVKTFANPARPVSLFDHFVTTELKHDKKGKAINQDDLIDKLKNPARVVVSATAGYGKSMLMRFMALSLYENPQGRIPIFIELRDLNRVTSPNLITYINAVYKTTNQIGVEAFRQGLQIGAFLLILDGFDEVNHELRKLIEDQILDVARMYPKTSIVVSGRPDDKFLSWRTFEVFKVEPMSKTRVIELINKLEYDRGTKKRFVSKIKSGLFETHQSFLSTPLLAILMLLTFEENANIPDKMHLFYAKAFETLFHKHDAMKEQYERQRKSSLQIDEFEKVFSIFCLNTYVLEKLEFTEVELIKFIRDALTYAQREANPADVLFDLDQAVCLIQKEGTSYFFVHRSFQEYFTAVFLASCPEEVRDEFIERVAARYWDNVLPMLFDMASDQLEPSWVMSNTDLYLQAIDHGRHDDRLNALLARWKWVTFYKSDEDEGLSHFAPGEFNRYLSVMQRFYPRELSGKYKNMSSILLSEVEKHVGLEKSKKREVTSGGRIYKIYEYSLEQIPRQLLDEHHLLDCAYQEVRSIRKLREGLDKQQNARNNFLQKLFHARGP
jgi:hypothetical protein